VKPFWRYIKDKQGNTNALGRMIYGDVTVGDPTNICQLFSSFFKSVFEPSNVTDVGDCEYQNHASDLTISDISISDRQLLEELCNLDISKGSGVDNIPPIFFDLLLRQSTNPYATYITCA
jgi:hypothetical protein